MRPKPDTANNWIVQVSFSLSWMVRTGQAHERKQRINHFTVQCRFCLYLSSGTHYSGNTGSGLFSDHHPQTSKQVASDLDPSTWSKYKIHLYCDIHVSRGLWTMIKSFQPRRLSLCVESRVRRRNIPGRKPCNKLCLMPR